MPKIFICQNGRISSFPYPSTNLPCFISISIDQSWAIILDPHGAVLAASIAIDQSWAIILDPHGANLRSFPEILFWTNKGSVRSVQSVGDLILIILAIFDFEIFLDHFGAFWTNPFFRSFSNTIRTNTGNIPYIFFLLSPSFKITSAPP